MTSRVLIAEDHQLVREGIRALLEKAGYFVVGEASDGREALRLAESLQPNVAVLDLSMPLLNGIDAVREILKVSPGTKPILLTMYTERPYVIQALQAGARGYVLKTQTSADLLRAMQEVLHGFVYVSPSAAVSLVDACRGNAPSLQDPLTSRERQVLQLVAEGMSTKAIADLLGIGFKTAESHRYRLMKKLDIHDTAGLVRYAIRRGLPSA